MRNLYLILVFIGCCAPLFAQKSFTGSLEYNVFSYNSLSKDTTNGKLFIYAIDSLVRFTYLMEDGSKQESIHHLIKHRFISLIEVEGAFFAVQIVDSTTTTPFPISKNRQRSTIAGLKVKGASIQYPNTGATLFYYPKIDARYFSGLNNAPGLPVTCQIPTETGFVSYQLVQIDKRQPPIHLFIPDKKYHVLTLEAFLEWAQQQNAPKN
jgi:hypothetical protein